MTEFIQEVRSSLKTYARANTIAVISTNEGNSSILEALQAQDRFVVLSPPFLQSVVGQKMEINPLNDYTISLSLMCDAKYFFAYGRSTAHEFVKDCRNHKIKKQIDLTFINTVVWRRKKG